MVAKLFPYDFAALEEAFDSFIMMNDPPVDVNLFEGGDSFLVEFFIPGYKKENIKLSLKDRTLEMTVNRDHSRVPEGYRDVFKSISWNGRLAKSLILPEDVDSNLTSALYEAGVLTVNIKKKAVANTAIKIC